jgi:hypothetical protein
MSGSYAASGSTYAYNDSAQGFARNIATATSNGSSDIAKFYDSPGNDTFNTYGNYNNSNKPFASMNDSTTTYANYAIGFGTNVAYSTSGGSDTAVFNGNDLYYQTTHGGKPMSGMIGTGYSNSASGFASNVKIATSNPFSSPFHNLITVHLYGH